MEQSIPADVKRQLRQEAGFGCCRCGHPFLQYHHIIPLAVERHNRPQDMMAVCGNCHHLFTVGAEPEVDQRKYKTTPRNVREGMSRGRLYTTSTELKVRVGGGMAVNTPNLLTTWNDRHIVSARLSDDGRVLLSALIQDIDGQLVAVLRDNEWSALPGRVWDFECSPMKATVRSAPGRLAFEADCRGEVVEVKGEWFVAGQRVTFTPSGFTVGTNSGSIGEARNCESFIFVG
ncbi:MAG: HNH endonuclease [Terricaulis sp.]